MTEDTQCETMGLQATSPPTSPLHRPPPPPPTVGLNTAPMLKRKHDLVDDDDEDVLMSVTTGGSGVKKICVEVVCNGSTEVTHDHRLNNSDEDIEDFSDDSEANTSSDSDSIEDSIMVTSSNDSHASDCEENKENNVNVNKLNKGELDSILAKTLLNTPTASPVVAAVASTAASTTVTTVTNDNDNPRVIVEHKPLPSIYDLQQMSAACDTLDDNTASSANSMPNMNMKENDSGVSDDEDDEDEVSDLDAESGEDDEDEDEEEPSSSPIFDPVLRGTPGKPLLPSPPKAIYSNDNRSFWNSQNSYNSNQTQQQQTQQQQQQQQAPPQSNTFQFLEQTTQRIECAENGKSYLQLGTMNAHSHHHLPVTPVIQPKPNMVYRRPIPPFNRNHMVSSISSSVSQGPPVASNNPASNSRPVCDHSNCLQKKNSFCYQSQRSRMLNMSLSKLHMARQSHDGSLRRSVLICNMLRYIEDETDREAMNETYPAMETDHHYWPQNQPPQPPPPQQPQQPPQPQNPGQPQPQPQQISVANSVTSAGISTSSAEAPLSFNMATGPQLNFSTTASNTPHVSTVVNTNPRDHMEPYETTLKDFNSAFRSTPYSSPAHPGSDLDSGLGVGDDVDRGINWSSVLSLSSQSELDPLNNNTFATEAWPSTVSAAASTASTTINVPNSNPMVTNVQQTTLTDISASRPESTCTTVTTVTSNSFDDIGWKLSADDVLKAFPNDENLFAVAGP